MPKNPSPEDHAINVAAPPGFDAQGVPVHQVCTFKKRLPLVLKEDGLSVLLTQRTQHLRDHAGQISFPGGRMDSQDQSPNDTALRESQEEIGLDPTRVEIVGHLPQYLTVSGYSVTPVVRFVQAQAEYVLDEFEAADVFEVPLRFLVDPANHQVRLWQSERGGRRFYSIPYKNRFI